MEIEQMVRMICMLLLGASLFSIFFHIGCGWHEKGREIEEMEKKAMEEPLPMAPALVVRRVAQVKRQKPLKVRFEGPLDKDQLGLLIEDAPAPLADSTEKHLTRWWSLSFRSRRYRN